MFWLYQREWTKSSHLYKKISFLLIKKKLSNKAYTALKE